MNESTTVDFAGFRFLRIRPPVDRRLVRLIPGLILYGVAIAMALKADLGTSPWTVFHKGLSETAGSWLSFGMAILLTGLVLLVLFRFVNEPMGLGTALNVLVIGFAADASLAVIPDVDAIGIQLALLVASPVVLGLASGLYIGAGLGPGPRDGLMTAMSRRGIKTWQARTIVELTALAIGWWMGGPVGLGTIWLAISVGPCVQFFLDRLRVDPVE